MSVDNQVRKPTSDASTACENNMETTQSPNVEGSDEAVEDFSKLKSTELQERLRKLNLMVSGRKQELVERLTAHYSPNGKSGASTDTEDEKGMQIVLTLFVCSAHLTTPFNLLSSISNTFCPLLAKATDTKAAKKAKGT